MEKGSHYATGHYAGKSKNKVYQVKDVFFIWFNAILRKMKGIVLGSVKE